MPPRFKRDDLRDRYDVPAIHEDVWHSFSDDKTREILDHFLDGHGDLPSLLLNAGSGVYSVNRKGWTEISVDLFSSPLRGRQNALCGSVEQLPFRSGVFGAVVCVGEVLAYCDPVSAIAEFARVLAPFGILICDFGSSRSVRYWFKESYGRAADMVTDSYNGSPEKIWIYEPTYIDNVLVRHGFRIRARFGTHTWSAAARRIGISMRWAMSVQKFLGMMALPSSWADLTTIVAVRASDAK